MSTLQSLDRNLQEEHTLRSSLALKGKLSRSAATASTRNENLTLVLRVEVDKHVACHKACLHAQSTCKLCFLVAGKHTLNRTVLNIVAVEDSQFYRTANTVVSTKGSALSSQPFAIHVCLNSILVEVEVYVYQLVAHHIHVALQDNSLLVLISRSCRLADNHVACFVNVGFQAVALAKRLKIFYHLFLTLRWTRNLVDFSKMLKYKSWFQFTIVHLFNIFN